MRTRICRNGRKVRWDRENLRFKHITIASVEAILGATIQVLLKVGKDFLTTTRVADLLELREFHTIDTGHKVVFPQPFSVHSIVAVIGARRTKMDRSSISAPHFAQAESAQS